MMPTSSLSGLARNAPRVATRTCARRVPRVPQQRRFQSTTSSSQTQQAAGNGTSHFASGVAGGVAGASILYGVYLMTPSGRMTSKINKAAKDANTKYQQVASTLKDKTPSTDEAVNKIKEIAVTIDKTNQRDTLLKLASTAMSSKLIKRNSVFFANSKSDLLCGEIGELG